MAVQANPEIREDQNLTIEALRVQLLAVLQHFPHHSSWDEDTGVVTADDSELDRLGGIFSGNCRWSGAEVSWTFGIP